MPDADASPATAPTELPRVLGPWLATAIVVGCVIGTGVFKKAHAISKELPESGLAIAVWVVVGLVTLCGAMTLAEVASLFPKAGGNYVFLREAYGRIFGFLWGWVEFWFLRVASCAALASVFSESLNDVLMLGRGSDVPILGFWAQQTVSAVVVAILGLIAARGTKLGATVSFGITTVKVGSIVALMLLPVVVWLSGFDSPVKPSVANYSPVAAAEWSFRLVSPFFAAMVAVMWPYNGWSNVAAIAGEIDRPQRNVPIAFVGGLILLIVIYSLVNIAYFSVLPASEMAALENRSVAAEVTRRLLGPIGLLLASAAIMISVFGALSGNMLVGPRGIYALSRDGLAPSTFAKIHGRFETPLNATMLMTGVTVVFIFAVAAYARFFQQGSKPPFDVITDFITFGAAAFETLAVGAIFIFRRRHRQEINRLPYRCPLYPIVPAIFCLAMIGVLVNMFLIPSQRMEALIGMGFIAVGAVLYLLVFGRSSTSAASRDAGK
jgi:amino acid transporter